MRTFANIIWYFPFFGFLNALASFFFAGLFFLTIIGAPIGMGLLQLGRFYLAPFGNRLVDGRTVGRNGNVGLSIWNIVAVVLWLPFGLFLAAVTVLQIGLLFVSIIGIPVGVALAKSLGALFNPVGKVVQPSEVVEELARRNAMARVDAIENRAAGLRR